MNEAVYYTRGFIGLAANVIYVYSNFMSRRYSVNIFI
jgi:hypothetical protein